MHTAHNIIDGIEEMEANRMLARGSYLTDVVDRDLQRAGSICEGRRACLIGSAFWAAGERELEHTNLAGVLSHERAKFVADKPALRAALIALDEAAGPCIEALSDLDREAVIAYLDHEPAVPGVTAEALFECTGFATLRGMPDLLSDAHRCLDARR